MLTFFPFSLSRNAPAFCRFAWLKMLITQMTKVRLTGDPTAI